MQYPLFEEWSPTADWDADLARRTLDELFTLTRQYKSSQAYHDLLRFMACFNWYSPFNAMLVHIQMPGATYVASPYRWARDYRRHITAGAHPIVMLQPMGPVMFVFDVGETEPEPGAPALPPEVEHPFETRHGRMGPELQLTIENARRDGVYVGDQTAGAQSAGTISVTKNGKPLPFTVISQAEPGTVLVPRRYELLLNSELSAEAKYATLAHELAHLYCGHLGTPNRSWWPDRHGVSLEVAELEAESICYLVCGRLGIDNPSESYLAGYVKSVDATPAISLECVVKVAGLIEQMGRVRLKPRKRSRAGK
jgi:hypothetical protein